MSSFSLALRDQFRGECVKRGITFDEGLRRLGEDVGLGLLSLKGKGTSRLGPSEVSEHELLYDLALRTNGKLDEEQARRLAELSARAYPGGEAA